MQESSPPERQGKKGGSSPRGKNASRSKGKGGARAKRGQQLSAEAIIDAAIGVADAEGLDAVSIRRVAAELDAGPMSLYSHISSKEDLLDLMASKLTAEILVQQPLPMEWRRAVTAIAKRQFAVFKAHPWLVLVFSRLARFGPNATRLAKQQARAVSSLALEPADVWQLLGTVNDYVLGHSLRAVAPPMGRELADAISPSDVVEFPELASLQDNLRGRSSAERFELGLQTVLDGIEERFLGR